MVTHIIILVCLVAIVACYVVIKAYDIAIAKFVRDVVKAPCTVVIVYWML